MSSLVSSAIFCLIVVICVVGAAVETDNYTVWTIPDQARDLVVEGTLPGAALIGGGQDCVPAFEYMINNAKQGDFVILRASGDDDYNQFVWDLAKANKVPLNSVTTILFKNRDASFDPVVQQTLQNAEAIFFAGGDQSLYIKYWQNTPVQNIIQSKLVNTTVGGTSAGLAIQGNWIYSADTGSAYSDECMENPYNIYATLAPHFLSIPFLSSFITDTHFSVRDRMGRMLTFASRIMVDYKAPVVHAVGVDETTALLLDTLTGDVQVVGQGHAFLCASAQAPSVCKPETELTFTGSYCISSV